MSLGRKKGWIGIDLGPRTLTVAQAERVGSGARVAASAVVHDPAADGESLAPDAAPHPWQAQDILAALSLDPGFSGRTVACLLPMHVTDLSVLTVPPAREAERRAMIAHELSAAFPNDRHQREFDFWEAAAAVTPDGAAKGNVNVLSVSRRVARRAVRSLSDAGLHCEVMDGLPFALARAVDMARGPDQRGPTGAVDWGCASGTFCVVSEGRPQFTRHLRTCGFGRVVDRVRQALSLSESETRQVLVDYGLPGPECPEGMHREIQGAIREVTAPLLSELAEELRRTLAYVRMKYAALVPERLCLFGEGATVKHVAAAVSERIGLPAEVWRVPSSQSEGRGVSRELTPLLGTTVALSALAWAL